ncbi:MAG: hypothetical protein E7485_07180 [Ruminococcaceae bacterium]|nr:hypothetical protein [Oscillospiraceae bacterium]
MHELLTDLEAQELLSGRLYIMDRTSGAAQPSQNSPDETPNTTEENVADKPEIVEDTGPVIAELDHSVRHSRTEHRLYGYAAAAFFGIVIGVMIALFFPLVGADPSLSVAAESDSGFMEALLRRLSQVGMFLLCEYICGYFAAGGMIVWLAPFIFGLGAGLSSAGICAAGGSAWVILPNLIYTATLTVGANASAEFSQLLLSLIEGKSSSVVLRGNTAGAYNLRFGVLLIFILAVALIEAAFKAA